MKSTKENSSIYRFFSLFLGSFVIIFAVLLFASEPIPYEAKRLIIVIMNFQISATPLVFILWLIFAIKSKLGNYLDKSKRIRLFLYAVLPLFFIILFWIFISI